MAAWAAGATGSELASSIPRKWYDENVYTLLFRNGSSNKLHDSVLWKSCQDCCLTDEVVFEYFINICDPDDIIPGRHGGL